jgi:hypothetical protein
MGKQIPINTFTSHFPGKTSAIINEVYISEPFKPDLKKPISKDDSRLLKKNALWDTGATHSVIKSTVAEEFGLKPIAISKVSHAGGISNANVYLINLFLPNKVAIPFVRVTGAPKISGNFDVIIGMDIITLGDFAITNLNNKTVVSFRMPSTEVIDFVAEIESTKKVGTPIQSNKVGRNAPCPCGSGKKYKHCCGK